MRPLILRKILNKKVKQYIYECAQSTLEFKLVIFLL